MSKDFLNVAVVGAGYWGKNLVRNFATAARCRLKYVCDLDEELLLRQKRNFPFIKTTTNLDEALADTEVDAVVVATEAQSHFEVAKGALEAGKSAYVEKPLTLKAGDSRALIELAKENGLKLMVGHLLVYHPGVNYVKKLIDSGQIGESYYMYTQRVNLGIVRQTENDRSASLITCTHSESILVLFAKRKMRGGLWRPTTSLLSVIYSIQSRSQWRHTGSVICRTASRMWCSQRLHSPTARWRMSIAVGWTRIRYAR